MKVDESIATKYVMYFSESVRGLSVALSSADRITRVTALAGRTIHMAALQGKGRAEISLRRGRVDKTFSWSRS